MDGYAVAAGDVPAEKVQQGTCSKIMTGATSI